MTLSAGRRLSVSGYGTYVECPQRYQYAYVQRLPRPETTVPHHWRFGSVVHKALEVAYLEFKRLELTGRLSQVTPQALAATRQSWVDLEMDPKGGELDRALGMVAATLERLVEHHENILGVEQRFLGYTPAGVPFVGFADLIRKYDDETVEVRDYKVRRKVSAPDELGRDLQGHMYGHFSLKDHPWAKRVVFSHLYPNHDVRLVAVELDGDESNELIERFEAVAEMINDDDRWTPRPGEHCGYCAYTDTCPAWAKAREEGEMQRQANF
jgi:putative RecB family exonuclease